MVSHAPAALTLCPLNMQLRWSHIRCLHTSMNNKTLSLRGIEPKLLSRQPLAQSPYDLGRVQKRFPLVISMSDFRIVLVSYTYFQRRKNNYFLCKQKTVTQRWGMTKDKT
jgi:hypothetical protein